MPSPIRPPIMDVEASGFGPESYPIEIGVVLPAGDRYCSLILPAGPWRYWDAAAEGVHGITREILRFHGRPHGEVASQLNRMLAGKTVYTDGWVVDKTWVDRLFYAAGMEQRFYLSSLETILSEGQMDVWHATKTRVIEELELTRHRASTDAFIVQETYARTRLLQAGCAASTRD